MENTKYDLQVEHEGHVATFVAGSEAEAIETARDLIANGDYDMEEGEEMTLLYWITPEGGERQSHSITLVG